MCYDRRTELGPVRLFETNFSKGDTMKHFTKRLSAAGLALSLLAGQSAMASEAMGHDLHESTTRLSAGTSITKELFWSDTYSDLRTGQYLTYVPNADVTPAVAYGGDWVLNKATLTAMAQSLEAQGRRVVGGANGDFYVVATGQPLGIVVTEGVVRSSSSYHYAIGFRTDGTAFIGQPGMTVTATMNGERVNVPGGINKVRQLTGKDNGGLLLLTGDFGSSTQNTSPGVDVVLRPLEDQWAVLEPPVTGEPPVSEPVPEPTASPEGETAGESEALLPPEGEKMPSEGEETSAEGEETPAEGEGQEPADPVPFTDPGADLPRSKELKINSRTRCQVVSVNEATGAGAIPEGCFVLTMNGKDDETILAKLRALQPGSQVDIDVQCADPRWAECTEAIGGMYRLLENGEIGKNLSAERTARTAIGIKPDGTVIFYTMDGKQPGYSVGATFTQIAMRLKEMGCVEAIGLDGGGSTMIGAATPAQDVFQLTNKPADGSQRAVSTAIFLTTGLTATGEPGYLQVTPAADFLLAGASAGMSADLIDTGYRAMGPAASPVYTAQGGGTVNGNVYTAGAESGSVTITAHQGTSLTGSAMVTVVKTPDSISLTNEATGNPVTTVALEPGESIDLKASAVWRKQTLLSQDSCYVWKCDAQVGTITSDGVFTAGEKSAAGNLAVTAGDKSLTIPVSVAGHIKTLADFEGENPFTTNENAAAILTGDLTHVKAGWKSLLVDYNVDEKGEARFGAGLVIPAGENHLGFWLYGDGSGNGLAPLCLTGDGEITGPETVLDFTGWKHIVLALPQGTEKLGGFLIAQKEETGAGRLWLDQLTTANEALEDMTPPVVHVKVENNVLTATVEDNVDKAFATGQVTAQLDGKDLPGSWNATSGTFTAALPASDGLSHRLTVTAADQSGNLGRASWDIQGESQMSFADMENHWAASFAGYLYEQGITKGVSAEEGVVYYQPGANITRAEFFTMVARWMGLDLAQYESVELPFADVNEIPEWALTAVKAMYQKGIVQGSLENGALYAHPGATITRGEVMTILGRTQQRGWGEDDLSRFSDQDGVADWARGYVQVLVGQGIVNGYEDGTLKPGASMTRGEVAKVLYAFR